MIRKLLATTAIATLIVSGAAPSGAATADTNAVAATAAPAAAPDGHLASKLIGARVFNGAGDSAENVGEVNDLVVGDDGKVNAIVIGVGGFLGLGQKDVAVPYASVQWTEHSGERWLVVSTTKDELKAQAAFDRAAYNPAAKPAVKDASASPNNTGPVVDTSAAASADKTTAAKGAVTAATGSAATEAVDSSTLKPVDAGTITAKDFIGTTVYGANDVKVGEIGDVALTSDGKVDAVVVDVGGFLGMGEKHVAMALDNLRFMGDSKGNRYLYTTYSKNELNSQPAYDKGSYASNRDKQRMTTAQ